jgi:hypothetical protein
MMKEFLISSNKPTTVSPGYQIRMPYPVNSRNTFVVANLKEYIVLN